MAPNVLKPCLCKSWEESMPQIVGAQILEHAHGGNYTGKKFIYCPWCGKKREVDNDQ